MSYMPSAYCGTVPWWPGLDEVIETARRFYPDSLAEGNAALAVGLPASS